MPTGVSPEVIAQRRLFRLHFPKVTGAPPSPDPIWIERDGFAFRQIDGAAPTTEAKENSDVTRLAEFLADEIRRGVRAHVDHARSLDSRASA